MPGREQCNCLKQAPSFVCFCGLKIGQYLHANIDSTATSVLPPALVASVHLYPIMKQTACCISLTLRTQSLPKHGEFELGDIYIKASFLPVN